MKKVKINLTYKDILDILEPSRTHNKSFKDRLKNLDKLELEVVKGSYYLDTEAAIGGHYLDIEASIGSYDYPIVEPIYIEKYPSIINHNLREEELQYDDIGINVINIDSLVCKTLELQVRKELPYSVSLKIIITNGNYCVASRIEKHLLDSDIQEV